MGHHKEMSLSSAHGGRLNTTSSLPSSLAGSSLLPSLNTWVPIHNRPCGQPGRRRQGRGSTGVPSRWTTCLLVADPWALHATAATLSSWFRRSWYGDPMVDMAVTTAGIL